MSDSALAVRFPNRLPLDPPEENGAALADVLADLGGAASRLGSLAAHLAGPAADAPGWLGCDAAAAAGQVGVLAGLVRAAHGALTDALGRLERHAELLDTVRSRIAALRREQEDDYAALAVRVAMVWGDVGAVPAEPGPRVDEAAAGFAERDAGRAHQHALLLADLRSDALDTAAVLAHSTAVVGGTGRRGDADRVTAHLAELLPGWGDGVLAARGIDLARRLLGPGTPDEFAAWARAAGVYAGSPAFANALLATLGPEAFGWLVDVVVTDGLGAGDALPRLLAEALGAAAPGRLPGDPVRAVLEGTYVGRDDPSRAADARALGLGILLAAGAALGRRGVPPRTAAAWGRQLLDREERLRATSGIGALGVPAGGEDAVGWVLRVLAAGNDPAASAALLGDRSVWTALLARPGAGYLAEGADLRRVVEQAGAVPGAAGERAVRTGLEVLGTGLSDGDPDHWPADRTTAAIVAFPLAQGVAAHVSVATDPVLRAGAGAALTGRQDAALRGLGLVSLDPGGSAVIQRALGEWASRTAAASADPLAAAVAIGGFVAVRQYGQRLAYALHGFEQRDEALSRQQFFDWTIGLLQFLPGAAGGIAGMVLPFLAHFVGADGTWANGRDSGVWLDEEDSAAVALVQLGSQEAAAVALARDARAGFRRLSAVLGLPVPPESPEWSPLQAVFDGAPLPGPGRDELGRYLPVVNGLAHPMR